MGALSAANVGEARMTSIGYGFERPIAPNNTPEGRADNRRIEFKVEQMSSNDAGGVL